MIALGMWGAVLWLRGRLFDSHAFLHACVAMGPSGFLAVLFGWVTAEVGRQPWVVYGTLRTADAVSPVGAGQVSASLLGFMVVYAVIFSAGATYILRLLREGPVAAAADKAPIYPRAPGTPLAAGPGEAAGEPSVEPRR